MHVNLTMEERLKDMRVNRRMTLEELAKATGISSSALANYENRARDISHRSIIKLADFYGVSSDYLLGITQTKEPIKTEIDDLRLNEEMIDLLKEGKINNRLLCEMVLHPSFPKLLADIEIYVDRTASMQIDTLNATVDAVRREIISKYHPDESDINMKTMEAAHIDETEYFFHRIADDLQPIIVDIRDAHKKGEADDPINTRADEIQKELKEAAEIPGSDQERQARFFLMQLGINYDSLYPDEFVTLINILKKSKMLKSPLSKRGKKRNKKEEKMRERKSL